jgi:Glycerophosphoryl diester phosphodiesterase family
MNRISAIILCLVAAAGDEPITPLPHAHAHNDYEHARPLLDALDHGFCSVEADVYLVNGALLVAHDLKDVHPDRTLRSLYLDPLLKRVRGNKGRVYSAGPEFTLMIDVKSEAVAANAAIDKVLRDYAEMLTVFHRDRTEPKAVTVIISGNRDRAAMAAQWPRLTGYDGRLQDLDSTDPAQLVPLISADWRSSFTWRGAGEFPDAERQKLQQIVQKAHAAHRRVRFWGTPDSPDVWKILVSERVDLLNTDDLPGLRRFLLDIRLK